MAFSAKQMIIARQIRRQKLQNTSTNKTPVAQLAEQSPHKAKVPGSYPGRGTN